MTEEVSVYTKIQIECVIEAHSPSNHIETQITKECTIHGIGGTIPRKEHRSRFCAVHGPVHCTETVKVYRYFVAIGWSRENVLFATKMMSVLLKLLQLPL